MVVEGMNALPPRWSWPKNIRWKCPSCETVDAIVNHGMSAAGAVARLMDRGLKNELPQAVK